jgi:hypothetical protein
MRVCPCDSIRDALSWALFLTFAEGVSACGAPARDGSVSSDASTLADATVPTDAGATHAGNDGGPASPADATIADAQPMCDAGACAACPAGLSTTIAGRVLDPAAANPVSGVVVFVPDPAAALPDLSTPPAATCGCDALYPSSVLAVATTGVDGSFTLADVPAAAIGTSGSLSVVVQLGKWRMESQVQGVTPCSGQSIADLRLPASDSEGSLPDIAISTGGADSLECLLLRIGISPSEYMGGGAGGSQHVHIFRGFNGADTLPAAPESYAALYDSLADLTAHDLVLLSCEGRETTGGTPGIPMTGQAQQNLYDYIQAGGRAFAGHFHDAWFRPTDDGGAQGFASSDVADSGVRVGTFQGNASNPEMINDSLSFPVDILTAEPDGAPFPEGVAFLQWLIGVDASSGDQVAEWFVRDNVVTLNQPPAKEWARLDPSVTQASVPGSPQYFSIDLGRSATSVPCGRIVYSDLHVSGPPGLAAPGVPPDYPDAGPGGGGTVPDQCAAHPLTAQEKMLEFMLFNLSSCLQPSAPPLR